MSRYSEERKVAVLDKMLPPHNLTISEVAAQEGISEACLYNWRKQAKLEGRPVPGSRKPTPEDWSSQDKFAVMMETASLTAQELSEYCRSKGLQEVLCLRQISRSRPETGLFKQGDIQHFKSVFVNPIQQTFTHGRYPGLSFFWLITF